MDNEELQQKASERFEQEQKRQEEAMSELAQAEGLGETTTVQLGEETIEVKSWVPGKVSETLGNFLQADQNENLSWMLENAGSLSSAVANLCVTSPYNEEWFWNRFYDKYGIEGIQLVLDTVASPALEGTESRMAVEDQDKKREAMGNWQKQTGDSAYQGH